MTNDENPERRERALTESSRTNGENRIQINNFMGAICIGVLAILLDKPEHQVTSWVIAQLAIAVPCLFTSSLAYSKLSYRPLRECRSWDRLG
jgi:hypothetical protein